jgi:4'-phosphopantetheinyl transferase
MTSLGPRVKSNVIGCEHGKTLEKLAGPQGGDRRPQKITPQIAASSVRSRCALPFGPHARNGMVTAHLRELSPGEAELFVAHARGPLSQASGRAYQALLSPEEAERHARLRVERHRQLFLLTRALARTTLSRFAPVQPEAWRFVDNEHGKPSISAPPEHRWLSFNLSNTEGAAVCLVAREIDVGVDIENTERGAQTLDVARHFFSALESSELLALAPERQNERFFAYWTLKEAYIKARGLGVAIPLDRFSFLFGPRPTDIHVVFEPELGDDPHSWQFARPAIAAPYALGVALRRGRGAPDLALRIEEVEP